MKPGRREALILGAAGIAAAAAGFLVGPMLLRSLPGKSGEARPESADIALRTAEFVDLTGRTRRLDEWLGRAVIYNFWATWCAPCREEIPLLMAFREKYASKRLEIVGIAVDNASKVRDFMTTFKISYPVLLAEADGLDLMRRLGNGAGGLPYTVVADRNGRVLHRKLGAYREDELGAILAPLA